MRRIGFIFIVAVACSAEPAQPCLAETVPHQFIAKTYTEALGRIPDSTGYGLSVQSFRKAGCSIETLKSWARQFYDSPMHPLAAEYAGNYPKGSGATTADSIARILTLYRGILNREPTLQEFNTRLSDYRSTPWSSVLEGILNGAEFVTLAPKICVQDFYGFGGPQYPAIDVPFAKPAFEILDCPAACVGFGQCRSDFADSDALQNAIYCASIQAGPSGTATIELAPQAVFRLNSTLLISGNVVIRTRAPAGGWNPFSSVQYALMARLVRGSNFGGPLVLLNRVTLSGVSVGHAKLQDVWVDGQRGPIEPNVADMNVAFAGGDGAEISGCRISNSAGWTNILVNGMSSGAECNAVNVQRNLITEYTSCHSKPDAPNVWADGISASCENTLIEDNQIVDVTDVGIVIFKGTESTRQRSVARRNSVLSSGNAAWAALGADPLYGNYQKEYDFAGTRFENNFIWSGDGHFDVGMLVGTAAAAWSGPPDMGRGATFVNNSLGWPALACSARVELGIVVSGMLDATVTGNRLGLELINVGNCPDIGAPCGVNPPPSTAAVVASRCAGLASGTIQDALDFRVLRCLGHSPPHPSCTAGFNVTPLPLDPGRDLRLPLAPTFTLDTAFPNPTRGEIVVRFTLGTSETVQFDLLDAAGRRVAHREAVSLDPGSHEITLGNREHLPPGLYVVKLSQGALQRLRQIVILD